VVTRLVLLVCLGLAGVAHADPRARCQAVQIGKRTLARVDLTGFFGKELLRLVRLGLEGRLRISLALVHRRSMWFDDVVLRVDREVTLSWDEETRQYLVDDLPVDPTALEPLVIDRIALGRRDDTAGSHYVELSVRLQVVTVTSLLSAAGWASGGGMARKDVVSTQVARAVVNDVTRKASSSCEVRRPP
jgi:hypothetical protein